MLKFTNKLSSKPESGSTSTPHGQGKDLKMKAPQEAKRWESAEVPAAEIAQRLRRMLIVRC